MKISFFFFQNYTRFLVGSQSGNISVFKNEEYTIPYTGLPGHKDSIEKIVEIDSNTFITGTGGGNIR